MLYLKVTYRLIALYVGLTGLLAIFFQHAGQLLFLFKPGDPVSTQLWGTAMLSLAVFYLIVSYDVERHHMLAWAGVIHLSMMLIATIDHLAVNAIDSNHAIMNILLLPIFIIILLTHIYQRDPKDVVLIIKDTGKPMLEPYSHLPAHTREKHPLHHK